jgi:hypothetical protein
MTRLFKKFSIIFASLMVCFITVLVLTGCGSKAEYTASSGFYWSSDAGATYKNGTKEYEVGENVYMQLIVRVDSTRKSQDKIGVTLTIPYVQDVVSKYYDGQVITPEVDELNHTTTYNFTVIASNNATDSKFIFKFIPTRATDITMTLIFDDNVDPIYYKQNTITFIESVSGPEA